MSPRVDLVTCPELPEPDPDAEPLLEALLERGLDARCRSWRGDSDAAWAPLAVIRSTWDYVHHLEDFRRWARGVDTTRTLLNPYPVVLWNSHKRYLVDFAARGVPVVPTEIVPRSPVEAQRAVRVALEREGRVVFKPTVSGGSFATHVLGEPDDALVARAVEAREMMLQPYMSGVDADEGERSLIWIDGALTHSIRKSPRFAEDAESVSEALPIADDARRFAESLLEPLSEALLYARVDVVRDAQSGALRLMELELIEPSLFLIQHPPALERLADAIERRARRLTDPA